MPWDWLFLTSLSRNKLEIFSWEMNRLDQFCFVFNVFHVRSEHSANFLFVIIETFREKRIFWIFYPLRTAKTRSCRFHWNFISFMRKFSFENSNYWGNSLKIFHFFNNSKGTSSAPKCRNSKFEPPLDAPGSILSNALRITAVRRKQKQKELHFLFAKIDEFWRKTKWVRNFIQNGRNHCCLMFGLSFIFWCWFEVRWKVLTLARPTMGQALKSKALKPT